MATFKIEGGHLLKGTITPQGAKNEALQVICATLLTSDQVIIRNIPDIRDVNNLIQLLSDIGVHVEKTGKDECSFQADEWVRPSWRNLAAIRLGAVGWTLTSWDSKTWVQNSSRFPSAMSTR